MPNPRKPSKLRQGPWQKCRHEGYGVEVDRRLPEPPAELNPLELKEWEKIKPHIESMGIVGEADELLLFAYCRLAARFRHYNDLNTAELREMRMICSDLGLTPHGRAKAKTPEKSNNSSNPFAKTKRKDRTKKSG